MEVSILSREIIKPSSTLSIQRLPPLKLNLLDQLTPSSYSPLILFYQNNHQKLKTNISQITKQLKWSLSQAQTLHYPVGGRVRDNFAIHDFCEGIPFVEARVKCKLCDFLYYQDGDDHGLEVLNNLLPLRAHRLVLDDAGPQIVVQLNEFECGGLALGFCSLHKTMDGVAARGLRAKARSRNLENPTRAEAVSSLLWKATMSYRDQSNETSYKSSILSQTVDLRRLTRSRLSRHSFGNTILFTDSVYDPKVHGEPPRIEVLAELVRDGVSKIDREYLKKISGQHGSGAILEYFDRLTESGDEEIDVLNVACLHGLGMGKIDFGWGPTVWVALGGPGLPTSGGRDDMPFMVNIATLLDNNKGGIEAWLTLKEPAMMRALENNLEFLDFVCTKSTILPRNCGKFVHKNVY
ncbi:(13S,14R)-1,13-dihydroxy-N-methylcanadine 13-O-acetyltransferase AT1 [Linum grandiflorum]